MFVEIFSSVREFFRKPYGLLLLLALMVPVIVISLIASNVAITLGIALSASTGFFAGVAYLVKNAFWLLFVYLISWLLMILFTSLAFTIVSNYQFNKSYELKRPLTNGLMQIFGLTLALQIILILLAVIFSLLSSILIVWIQLILTIVFILVVLIVGPRLFFVAVVAIDKNKKIRDAFSVSWIQTKDYYFSIIFFFILYFCISYFLNYLIAQNTLWFTFTGDATVVLLLDAVLYLIVDTVLMYWMISLMINTYER